MNAGETKLEIQRLLGIPEAERAQVIGPKTRAAFELLTGTGNDKQWPPGQGADTVLGAIAGRNVYRTASGSLFFTGGMTIDADGAPTCYHPESFKGLDDLVNAGHPGNWWGIVTDTDHIEGKVGKGRPLIQGRDAPAFSPETAGFYVSTTALADNPELPISDQRRYVNALEVPFIVLPRGFPVKFRLGRRVLVSYQGKTVEAIYGDVGGNDHLGEGSVALARALGIPDDPRRGGVSKLASSVRYEIPA